MVSKMRGFIGILGLNLGAYFSVNLMKSISVILNCPLSILEMVAGVVCSVWATWACVSRRERLRVRMKLANWLFNPFFLINESILLLNLCVK